MRRLAGPGHPGRHVHPLEGLRLRIPESPGDGAVHVSAEGRRRTGRVADRLEREVIDEGQARRREQLVERGRDHRRRRDPRRRRDRRATAAGPRIEQLPGRGGGGRGRAGHERRREQKPFDALGLARGERPDHAGPVLGIAGAQPVEQRRPRRRPEPRHQPAGQVALPRFDRRPGVEQRHERGQGVDAGAGQAVGRGLPRGRRRAGQVSGRLRHQPRVAPPDAARLEDRPHELARGRLPLTHRPVEPDERRFVGRVGQIREHVGRSRAGLVGQRGQLGEILLSGRGRVDAAGLQGGVEQRLGRLATRQRERGVERVDDGPLDRVERRGGVLRQHGRRAARRHEHEPGP